MSVQDMILPWNCGILNFTQDLKIVRLPEGTSVDALLNKAGERGGPKPKKARQSNWLKDLDSSPKPLWLMQYTAIFFGSRLIQPIASRYSKLAQHFFEKEDKPAGSFARDGDKFVVDNSVRWQKQTRTCDVSVYCMSHKGLRLKSKSCSQLD